MTERYHGSCHCGRVRFRAELDLAQGTFQCNCSICTKTAAWLAFVKPAQLTVLAGEAELVDYQFGAHNVHHTFCRHCGVRTFARVDDAGGEPAVAVRLACLDDVDPAALAAAPVTQLDGRHA
jgi:hypothetical protein